MNVSEVQGIFRVYAGSTRTDNFEFDLEDAEMPIAVGAFRKEEFIGERQRFNRASSATGEGPRFDNPNQRFAFVEMGLSYRNGLFAGKGRETHVEIEFNFVFQPDDG